MKNPTDAGFFIIVLRSMPNSYRRARLRKVRKLILDRDPETMAVLESIKMLETRKGLIAPRWLPLDKTRSPSRKKKREGGERAGTN
jgi:hypothetical protein